MSTRSPVLRVTCAILLTFTFAFSPTLAQDGRRQPRPQPRPDPRQVRLPDARNKSPQFHVLVGVIYILAVLAQYLRGHAGAHQIEILGLYWCFVDFVWIFVFSFVYLMP